MSLTVNDVQFGAFIQFLKEEFAKKGAVIRKAAQASALQQSVGIGRDSTGAMLNKLGIRMT